MGNPTTDLTAKAYTHKEKRGKNITEAKAGKCNYSGNNGVNPQKATVKKYTKTQKQNRRSNPATVGNISKRVVNGCRNNDPATAGITTKRVGG